MWLDRVNRENRNTSNILAAIYNCNAFKFDGEGIIWEPDDFLGTGDRAARKAEAFKAKMMTQRIMSGNAPPPDWAQELIDNNKKYGRH